MTCEACAPLSDTIRIREPRDLTGVINMAKDAVTRGLLEQVDDAPDAATTVETVSISDLGADGPWHDFFTYRFRCTSCRQTFQLSAETYHGSGGVWSKESRPPTA